MDILNHSNLTKTKPSSDSHLSTDNELFELTWNEILYDDGLATWMPRSSFRWLTICVCIIGVIGNILAVYTLLRPRMRTLSTYIYLTALCISNTFTLISVIVFEVEVFLKPDYLSCFTVSIAKALTSTTIALSIWITVGFTIDRYVMICFPFLGGHKCTRRNAIYVIITCLIASLSYLIPQLLAQKCHPITQYPYNLTINPENLTSIKQSEPTALIYWTSGLSELGESLAYRLTITLFFNCFLIRIIPFIVVFKLNVRLIQTLAQTKRLHRQMNPYEEKRNDVTYMLVIVISIYLVCLMPSIPFAAIFAYDPNKYVEVSLHYRLFQYIEEFTKFLMIFNSASQCFLYIFFGKRFRRELISFLCCLCVKYFYMPIPQVYSNIDREQFAPGIWNPNHGVDVVLQGEWSVNPRQESITGIEFSFHYQKRSSHLTTSSDTSTRSTSENNDNQNSFNLLKRFRNRFEQFNSLFN